MVNPACSIGIDVGGTKIAGGILSLRDQEPVVTTHRQTLSQRGGEQVLQEVEEMAGQLLETARQLGFEPSGMGVGLPELISTHGKVASCYHFDMRGLPVAARLSKIIPCAIVSDVRAAALAEASLGAGRNYRIFAYISVGTGISHTLVIEGIPYAGARGYALLFAAGAQRQHCAHCGSPSAFVMEDFSSGPNIVRRYNELRGSRLSRVEELIAIQADDEDALHILQSAGEALGGGVGQLVNILDPEAIVVGGGLGMAEGTYWDHFLRATRAAIWSDEARSMPISHAALGNQAGWIGAALSVSLQSAA
jgi:glucokinase